MVRITWIPGHANVVGNVRADALAKSASLSPLITLNIPLQRSAMTGLARRHEYRLGEMENRRWLAVESRSTRWYQAATKGEPTPVTAYTPRWLATVISRLRLGYLCNWEIIEGRERACQHCGQETGESLLHYLLDCVHTTSLRRGTTVPEGTSRLLEAATVVAHIMEEVETHKDTLAAFPPPR